MADDLAAKLAQAFTLAAGRMLPTSGYQVGKVTELLAADLRRVLESSVPEWYAGYDAGCRDQAPALVAADLERDERPRHGRTCSSDPEIGCECGLADWQADHPAPPVPCPHGDPLCPCTGRDHQRARDHAFQQGWDYEAERRGR